MIGTPTRAGFHTVTPYLVARQVDTLLAFVQGAFGATETFRAPGDDGGAHIEVRLGDSMVMLGGTGGASALPAMLYLYVEDVDAVYERAVGAGAVSIMVPADQPDGDRRGGVQDPCGNQWYIATHRRDAPTGEPA